MVSLTLDRHDLTSAAASRSTKPPATGARVLQREALALIELQRSRRQ
jgi:hypothetical protein